MADDLLSEKPRCGNCKHWNLDNASYCDDLRHCAAIDSEDNKLISVSWVGTFTAPDFFCALFEHK